MNLERYECDGQISIFDMSWGAEMKCQQAKTRNAGKPRKAPVWHYSLTSVYTTCPGCKAMNTDGKTKYSYVSKSNYYENYNACTECGQPLDQSEKAIFESAIFSRDFLAENAGWIENWRREVYGEYNREEREDENGTC